MLNDTELEACYAYLSDAKRLYTDFEKKITPKWQKNKMRLNIM